MAKGVGALKGLLTSDMEMQSLEFAHMVLGLVLAQYFLTMLPYLHFGVVMYILCHDILEVYNLINDFHFIMFTVQRWHEFQRRLWTFTDC